jgi:lysophospholipase L1-like esterase
MTALARRTETTPNRGVDISTQPLAHSLPVSAGRSVFTPCDVLSRQWEVPHIAVPLSSVGAGLALVSQTHDRFDSGWKTYKFCRGAIMKILRAFSCVCLVSGLYGSGAIQAHERDQVLVLGDSVAFAYINSAGYEYINPENFVGFANDLHHRLDVEVVDAGCPGETTGSFLSSTAPDNGCRAYRAAFPLHVAYGSTQLHFAGEYLRHNRDVHAVTITLGANDGFLLEASCATQANPTTCIEDGVPSLLASVAANLQTILADLRATGFGGAIILTNYYSVDYSDAAGTGLTELLNTAIAAPARAYGAAVADLFTAFKQVADNPQYGGKTCNAGLLNASVQNQLLCDVHPSQSGHRLIAETLIRTYQLNKDRQDF